MWLVDTVCAGDIAEVALGLRNEWLEYEPGRMNAMDESMRVGIGFTEWCGRNGSPRVIGEA